VGPRVRLGLNVGATEGEVTEEVVFEALVSSLTDSAVDVFIDLVMPTEGETVVALLAPTRVRLLPSRTRMNQESMLTSFMEMKLSGRKICIPLSVLLRMSLRCGRNKEVAARSVKLCPGLLLELFRFSDLSKRHLEGGFNSFS